MVTITSRAELKRPGIDTVRFEGAEHGAGISLFWVDAAPGTGPNAHKHPYTETWVVLQGEALIQIEQEHVAVSKGHIVTVPAGTIHRFDNCGSDPLEMLCIHASAVVIQEFITETEPVASAGDSSPPRRETSAR